MKFLQEWRNYLESFPLAAWPSGDCLPVAGEFSGQFQPNHRSGFSEVSTFVQAMVNSCYGPRKQSKEIFIKGFTSNSVIRSPFHGGRRHFAAHNFPEDALDWSVAKFVLLTALTRQQKNGAPEGHETRNVTVDSKIAEILSASSLIVQNNVQQ